LRGGRDNRRLGAWDCYQFLRVCQGPCGGPEVEQHERGDEVPRGGRVKGQKLFWSLKPKWELKKREEAERGKKKRK